MNNDTVFQLFSSLLTNVVNDSWMVRICEFIQQDILHIEINMTFRKINMINHGRLQSTVMIHCTLIPNLFTPYTTQTGKHMTFNCCIPDQDHVLHSRPTFHQTQSSIVVSHKHFIATFQQTHDLQLLYSRPRSHKKANLVKFKIWDKKKRKENETKQIADKHYALNLKDYFSSIK